MSSTGPISGHSIYEVWSAVVMRASRQPKDRIRPAANAVLVVAPPLPSARLHRQATDCRDDFLVEQIELEAESIAAKRGFPEAERCRRIAGFEKALSGTRMVANAGSPVARSEQFPRVDVHTTMLHENRERGAYRSMTSLEREETRGVNRDAPTMSCS